VSLGEYEEVFPMYLTKDEKSAVDNSRKSIETLQSELDELKEFKADIELEEKENILSEYSESIKKEDYDKIKGRFSEMSVDDVKKEVALILLESNKFSSKEQTAKVGAVKTSSNNPYGEASVYFTKR